MGLTLCHAVAGLPHPHADAYTIVAALAVAAVAWLAVLATEVRR